MGVAKATLHFGPETMLQRVVRLLSEVVSPIVVVAAPRQALPQLPANVAVAQDEHEGRGPLEGLRAGLKALPVGTEAAYVTSCDVPLLVPAFVRHMIDLLTDHDIAVMEIDGFTHPLSAVYRRNTLAEVEALLARDRLRPAFLFEAVRTRRVQPADMISADPELLTLRNLNTREDYLEALSIAGLADDAGPRERPTWPRSDDIRSRAPQVADGDRRQIAWQGRLRNRSGNVSSSASNRPED
jgi:molybdopterin-guanine dinucleotide biosynthesis protein A